MIPGFTEEVEFQDPEELISLGEETKNFSIRLGDSIMRTLKLSRVRPLPPPSPFPLLPPWSCEFEVSETDELQVDDYDVAFISGVVHFDPETELPVLERDSIVSQPLLIAPLLRRMHKPSTTSSDADGKIDKDEDTTMEPPVLASSDEGEGENVFPPLPSSLFIGDLRLTILKDRLAALGVPSFFSASGVLLCGPAPPAAFNFIPSSVAASVDPRRGKKEVEEEGTARSGGRVAVRKEGRGKLVIEGSAGETYFLVRKTVYALHAMAG